MIYYGSDTKFEIKVGYW